MNLDPVIAEMEAEVLRIQTAIAALRALQPSTSRPGAASAPSIPPAAAVLPVRSRVKVNGHPASDDEIAAARARWEDGWTANKIATALGRSPTWVCSMARQHGWTKRSSGRPRKPAPAVVEERTCPHCKRRTHVNPCDKCFERA